MYVCVGSHMVFAGSHIDWLLVGGFWPEQVVSKHSWAPRWIGCDCAYYSYIDLEYTHTRCNKTSLHSTPPEVDNQLKLGILRMHVNFWALPCHSAGNCLWDSAMPFHELGALNFVTLPCNSSGNCLWDSPMNFVILPLGLLPVEAPIGFAN